MPTRRRFLGALGAPAALAACGVLNPARAGQALAAMARTTRSPESVARDEPLWFEVAQAFTVDRSLIDASRPVANRHGQPPSR